MSYQNERWYQLLRDSVNASTNDAIAQKLGISRTTVSLVVRGKYPADTKRIAAIVLSALDRWHCPYLNTDITAEDCAAARSGPTPSHDPMRLAHRRMCRTCSHNTQQGKTS